jgi:hypothetical protein
MEAFFHPNRWRRIGVWPRGDQVRRTGGISETADSSKKTIQAVSAAAPFFDPRPLVLHPVLDGLLVALAGPPLGPLQRPAEALAQDHPHMAGVITDPGQLGDHHRDAFQGPQVGVEPIRHRPCQQGLLDLGELGGRQLGIGAGRAAAAQGVHTALLEPGVPDVRALAGHTELLGDLGLGAALGEQLGRLEPSGLKSSTLLGRVEAALGGHRRTLTHHPPSRQPNPRNSISDATRNPLAPRRRGHDVSWC